MVRLLTCFSLALIAGASLGGCSKGSEGPAFGADTLRLAVISEPATLDPLISDAADETSIEEAIFNGLLKTDADGRLLPDLALEVPSRANGGISKDLRTITYRLRHHVFWQDGVPFTSADVVFTYHALISGSVAAPQRLFYEQIASLTAPSPYTVVVHLRRPSAAAIRELFVAGSVFIVPKHLLRGVADIRHSAFNVRPVGTGPFALRSWHRGDHIDLVANDRYFAGKPRIREIRVMIVPKATTRAALLREGGLDLAPVKPAGIPLLRGSSQIRLYESRSSNIFYLELNTRRSPLDERAVRDALAYAVNRSQLVKPFAGMARPAFSLLPPGSFISNAAAGPCRGGREVLARSMLARAGWSRGKDGIRTRGGQSLAVEIVYDPGPIMGGMALQLQQAWKNLGVRTTLRAVPFGVLYGSRGLVTTGRYDIAVDELSITDPSDLLAIAGSSSIPPGGFNFPHYKNANVDRWLRAADASGNDRVRAQLYGKADRALCRDVPFIPLLWEKYLTAVNRRVQGFSPGPMDSDLWNVASWSLK